MRRRCLHALLDDGELGPMIRPGLARLHDDLGELEIADQLAVAAIDVTRRLSLVAMRVCGSRSRILHGV